MYIDCHNCQHHAFKKQIHVSLIDAFTHPVSQLTAQDTAHCHEQKKPQIHFRNSPRQHRLANAEYLRNQNNKQRIDRSLFGAHRKTEIQNHEIDGASSDSQKRRRTAQQQTHTQPRKSVFYFQGPNLLFADCVDKGQSRNGQKHRRLNQAQHVLRAGSVPDFLEHNLSDHPSCRRAQGERQDLFHIYLLLRLPQRASDRHRGHSQNCAARQETDGRHA